MKVPTTFWVAVSALGTRMGRPLVTVSKHGALRTVPMVLAMATR